MTHKILFGLASLFLTIGNYAQQKNDWENPAIISENKLPPRATMYSFKNESDALTYDRTKTDRVFSLNGEWQFNFSKNPNEAPTNFLENAFADWKPIQVPTNWEMQGFGTRIYTNSKHPWGHQNWPKISDTDNPVGIYKKSFDFPKKWKDMDIRIHFGGVTSAFYIWINGKKVGYSQGSRTPAEFDITPYLNSGKNEVVLKVFRWSDGSYIESQDGWRLSGIHRDVLLMAEPKVSISDFSIKTELDPIYKDAVLRVSPQLHIGEGYDPKKYNLSATLYDGKDAIKDAMIPVTKYTNFWYNQRWNPDYNLINLEIPNPKKWSAEAPNLYTLVLSIKDTKGKILESKSTKIGFRAYETKNGVFMVNGKAVKLYGVNRHDHNAKTGKTVSYADMKRDMELLKLYNFNAVRCSHYPNNPEFYDLCDEYGIYVMDEANVESHGARGGGGELANNPQWTQSFVDRAIRMYERDKNHPSIFSWSLGNESGVGANHAAMAGYLKWKNPERLIHFEPAEARGGKLSPQTPNTSPDPFDFTDMISRMYPSPDEFIQMDASQVGKKPVIACEYTHAMGNSNGGLKEIWDNIHTHERLAGAFIWDWMDQGILVKEKDGCEQYAYGGYFGDPINDGNFCINGVINSDQSIKPVMLECKYVFQPFTFTSLNQKDLSFTLCNRFAFTSSKDYSFTYQLLEDGIPTTTSGVLNVPEIEAGTVKKIKLPKLTLSGNHEYFVTITAKNKNATLWSTPEYVVASEQFPINYTPKYVAPNTVSSNSLSAEENGTSLNVSAPNFKAVFNKTTGYLEMLSFENTSLITKPIKPNFWRAVTDNDRAVIKRKKGIEIWKNATYDQKLTLFNFTKTAQGAIVVNTSYTLADSDLKFTMEYTIHPNLSIEIENQLDAPTTLENLPRVGLQTGIANDLTNISWYGKGPHENYIDRNHSAFVGVYTSSLENLGTSYVYPQANANRTDTRWTSFTNSAKKGLKIEGNFEFSAYPQSMENLDAATYKCELQNDTAITINLDHKQQGVGGYNSWSLKAAPLAEHRIPSKNYTFKFLLNFVK